MSSAAALGGNFERLDGGQARVVGPLGFSTVGQLLPLGSAAIAAGAAGIIDLGGVTSADSAGLALLIEWLSVAHAAGHALRYANMPAQLHQLALLSEVDDLMKAS